MPSPTWASRPTSKPSLSTNSSRLYPHSAARSCQRSAWLRRLAGGRVQKSPLSWSTRVALFGSARIATRRLSRSPWFSWARSGSSCAFSSTVFSSGPSSLFSPSLAACAPSASSSPASGPSGLARGSGGGTDSGGGEGGSKAMDGFSSGASGPDGGPGAAIQSRTSPNPATEARRAMTSTKGQNSWGHRGGQKAGKGRLPSRFRRTSSRSLSQSQAPLATRSSPSRFHGGS